MIAKIVDILTLPRLTSFSVGNSVRVMMALMICSPPPFPCRADSEPAGDLDDRAGLQFFEAFLHSFALFAFRKASRNCLR